MHRDAREWQMVVDQGFLIVKNNALKKCLSLCWTKGHRLCTMSEPSQSASESERERESDGKG